MSMNERQGIPLKLINTTLGPREVEFRQRQALARFGRGPALPGSLDFVGACAMVDTALTLNEALRPLWLDIIDAWNKPGCAAFTSWSLGNDNLQQYKEKLLSTGKLEWKYIGRAYEEWQATFKQDTDVIYQNSLIDKFIIEGFNGPIDPVLRRVLGAVEYLRAPKHKVRVTADKAPRLKHAIAFMSWCDHEGIDLQEIDRQRMGNDYDLVTSGKKPTTVYGRKRKTEINELVTNEGLSFISDKTIYSGAERWYYARVIRGSITEAATEYAVYRPTFENEIKLFDHIAGLR